ncbi:MAG: hypothetical protein EZS28_035395 [Streblomastix strix]|uniref:Uncharacterized protein n=1 Tax=Streblomastix strix TaxID=222440 RepID=A0A5J4UEL6_9EUKA|nr:MAG: hypothetical protein EZS28_035395 [Streblomastix strix]
MTLFEPLTANITIAIEALEQLHIDWHAIWKAIYEAGIKFACESKLQFVTLKANSQFEISTQEPWVIRRKEDGVQKKTGAQIVYLTDSNDRRVAETVNFVDQSLCQWYDQYILQYSEKYPQKIYTQHKPKKSKKLAKDELYQVIAQKQFPFKSKYDVIHKANYYDIPTHQTKNQFDIYPQTNTLEPHDYQLKPLSKFERPYFSPNYNSWEIDQQFQ